MEKPSIAIPHVSFEATKKAVLALYAFGKPGSAKRIMGLAGLNKTNSSKALSVSRSLGFVEETQLGVYQLTETGKDLARLIGFGKNEETKTIVREAIMCSTEWMEVVEFLRASTGRPRNPLDLVMFVESRLDKHWKPSMRNSLASMYKSVLIAGGLISSEEGLVVPLLDSLEKPSTEVSEVIPVPATEAEITGSAKGEDLDYITFTMPGLLSIRIRASRKALSMLRGQTKDGTPIAAWIDASSMFLETGNDKEGV